MILLAAETVFADVCASWSAETEVWLAICLTRLVCAGTTERSAHDTLIAVRRLYHRPLAPQQTPKEEPWQENSPLDGPHLPSGETLLGVGMKTLEKLEVGVRDEADAEEPTLIEAEDGDPTGIFTKV